MSIISPRSIFKIVTILVTVILLAAYGYFQAHTMITGPTLSINSPQNGAVIASTSPETLLQGTATNISFITVNGLKIFTDEHGTFARTLLLAPGYNIITVEVKDKFNRTITKRLQLIVN